MAKATAPDTTAFPFLKPQWPSSRLINSNARPIAPGRAIISKVAPASMPQAAVLPPLSSHHLKYRESLAEIARLDGDDHSPGMNTDEKEAAIEAACEEAMALERETWATPAKTLADVLLAADGALQREWRDGGLDDPEAYYDERSVAQLIRAVVDVSGDKMVPDPILTAVSVTNPSGTYSLTTPRGECLVWIERPSSKRAAPSRSS